MQQCFTGATKVEVLPAGCGSGADEVTGGAMTQRLIAATRNQAKVATLSRLVRGVAYVAPPPDGISRESQGGDGVFGDEEEGDSFEAVAAEKALAWSRVIGDRELVVATDGGLLIPALGEAWQPLRTRRFAGDAAADGQRADALLALAARLHGSQRRIAWREALAVASDGRVLVHWVAESGPGILARDYDPAAIAAGRGFWIPALWICPGSGGRRLSDLTDAERAERRDHWWRLGLHLRAFLIQHTGHRRTND